MVDSHWRQCRERCRSPGYYGVAGIDVRYDTRPRAPPGGRARSRSRRFPATNAYEPRCLSLAGARERRTEGRGDPRGGARGVSAYAFSICNVCNAAR